MKTSLTILLLLLVLLLPCFAWQEQTERMAQQLPPQDVLILNVENYSVTFGLSCDDRNTFLAKILDGRQINRFRCDQPNARMWIHINTDLPDQSHKQTLRPLMAGNRYEIFWNLRRSKWDVRLMQPSGQQ